MAMAMAALGVPQGAVALTCAEPREQSALQMRVLQTEFMIAALSSYFRLTTNLRLLLLPLQ